MTTSNNLTRRGFLGAVAALGAVGLKGCALDNRTAATQFADRSAGKLPERAEFVVRDAHVLTMDPKLGDLQRGDIHVRAGQIVAVGNNLSLSGVEVINGGRMIALPGLIDTHFHLWNTPLRNLVGEGPKAGYFPTTLRLGQQFTPTDIYRGVRLGVAELLYSGITTVHDWSHNIRGPAFADADLRALTDTGIRARFSYGTPQGGLSAEAQMDLADLARVQREWFGRPGEGMLSLGMASRSLADSARGPGAATVVLKDWEGARKLGLPITIHASARGLGERLGREGWLGPDIQLINGSSFTATDREWAAKAGAHISLSPFSNMRSSFNFSQLGELVALGVTVSLSIDTPAISGNTDMFAHMRLLTDMECARSRDPLKVSARQVLEIATIGGARDLGIADRVGSLTPGKRADLILVRTTDLNMAPLGDPVNAIVHSAQPYNVDTVIVDGRVLKRKGQLTALDAEQVMREAAESLAAVRARAGDS